MKRHKAPSTATPGRWSVYRITSDGEQLVRSRLTFEQAVKIAETVIPKLRKGERVSVREWWVVPWGTVTQRF